MARYTPRDKFYRKAREKGLASRAAFKIEELIDRFKLVAMGARIVDLGCAPGGWLSILARAAGPEGIVVGVDLVECRNRPPGVVTIVGDIRDNAISAEIAELLGGPADLITSDLSPRLTGVADRDQAASRRLIDAALMLAARLLKPGGAMVAKLFMGAEFKDAAAMFKRRFEKADIARTGATRPGSSELYVVAEGFRRAQD